MKGRTMRNHYILADQGAKLIISASTPDDALLMAATIHGQSWNDASIEQLNASPGFRGWTLTLIISDGPDGEPDIVVSETGRISDGSIFNMVHRCLPRLQDVDKNRSATTNDEFHQLILSGYGAQEVSVLMTPDGEAVNFSFVKEIRTEGEDLIVDFFSPDEKILPFIH